MSIIDVKVLLGILFFIVSCLAFFSMLHLLGTPHTEHARSLRVTHRSAGIVAVVLYVILTILCIALPLRQGGELSPRGTLHLTLAALFAPLILLKIMIVEKYPELRNRLFAVGSLLFALVFVIFFTSSVVHLIRSGPEAPVEADSGAGRDPGVDKDVFVARCSKCHRLDRALTASKTAQQWRRTVERMRQKDPAWMSRAEADRIHDFLISLEH